MVLIGVKVAGIRSGKSGVGPFPPKKMCKAAADLGPSVHFFLSEINSSTAVCRVAPHLFCCCYLEFLPK